MDDEVYLHQTPVSIFPLTDLQGSVAITT